MSIVVNTDFTGKYHIPVTKYNDTILDEYIEKYERKYLTMLLGVELYDLFMDELDAHNPPTTPIYKVIYDYLAFDSTCQTFVSNGIKEMLIGFIYFHYVSDGQQYQSPIGIVGQNGENGEVLNITSLSIQRYNDNVDSFRAIQQYIEENSSDYLSYNGQYLRYEYTL